MIKNHKDPRAEKARSRRSPDYSRDPAGCFARHAHKADRRLRHMGVKGKRPKIYWVTTLGWRASI